MRSLKLGYATRATACQDGNRGSKTWFDDSKIRSFLVLSFVQGVTDLSFFSREKDAMNRLRMRFRDYLDSKENNVDATSEEAMDGSRWSPQRPMHT